MIRVFRPTSSIEPSGAWLTRTTLASHVSLRDGRVARAVARPGPLRSEQGDFHHSAPPPSSLRELRPRSIRRPGFVEAGALGDKRGIAPKSGVWRDDSAAGAT